SMGRGDEESRPRRTFAVLGEMLELGEESVSAHSDIGELVVRLNITRTIVVGEGAKPIFNAANLEGSWGNEATWVATAAEAKDLTNCTNPPETQVCATSETKSPVYRGLNDRRTARSLSGSHPRAGGHPAVHPGARQAGIRPVRP